MSSENYVNHYVEILGSTLNETVLRNVSLQANARVSDEIIGSLQNTIEELKNIIENLKSEMENVKLTSQNNETNRVKGLEDNIGSLNNELNQLRGMKAEFDNTKHLVQNVDVFRNDLNKERDAHQKTRNEYDTKIKLLNEKIDYLQLTPAQKKKLDIKKTPEQTELKDGGSF
jgi:chromosome segregation ATPase